MYKIIITEHFKKQLKNLLKKNRSLKGVLIYELSHFRKEHEISIGHGAYKLRLKGHSKGKSGGYRLYIFFMEIEGILAPICLYSKSEKTDLNYKELTYHLKQTKDELERLL